MIIGHGDIESLLKERFEQGRLSHGLMLCGAKGIGKATLARSFAKHVLLSQANMHAEERFDAGSHAGLIWVSRETDSKKGTLKTGIAAEQVRHISNELAMTPGEGSWRVVVIDAMDDMGVAAANSLLKILEEPPLHTLFLLVVHQPGQILPTIRSRCQLVNFLPLSKTDYLRIMQQQVDDASDETLLVLGDLADYSPGLALELHEQGAFSFYLQLQELWESLPEMPHEQILDVAKWVGSGAAATPRWQLFSHLILHLLADAAKAASSPEQMQYWSSLWQVASEQLITAEKLHLDYSAVIISFFNALAHKKPLNLAA